MPSHVGGGGSSGGSGAGTSGVSSSGARDVAMAEEDGGGGGKATSGISKKAWRPRGKSGKGKSHDKRGSLGAKMVEAGASEAAAG